MLRPRRRAVVKVSAGEQSAYVKVLRSHLFADVLQRHQVLASSGRSGRHQEIRLPDGFFAEVLAQTMPALLISSPMVNFANAEKVLFFARQKAQMSIGEVDARTASPVTKQPRFYIVEGYVAL